MTTDTQLVPTDAEIDALWALLSSAAIASPTKFAREVLARWRQPAHSEKPVAWMRDWDVYDPSNSGPEFSHTKKKKSKGWVPLYTAPQPVEREPLTDEQWQHIADLTDSILTRATKDEIERVIGIKGGQHGTE